MAEAYITGADQLRVMRDTLKAAPKQLRTEVVRTMREGVKPVAKDVQDVVRDAPSHAEGEYSAKSRRAAKRLNMTKGLSEASARKRAEKRGTTVAEEQAKHRAKQAAKALSGAGLRDSIARTVSTSVSASGPAGVNATFRTRSDRMPNLQRTLPKRFNSPKGWRHPVFGNREAWAKQYGTPYFDPTIKKHRDELVERVGNAVQKIADTLAREN